MKAYVIKNKEGQYFVGYDLLINKNIFTYDISKAILTSNKTCEELLKEYDLKDCEVVKITIAEGDLEKEIEQLNKYLELDWAMTPQRMDGKSMTKRKIIENWRKESRKQVCEEIRDYIHSRECKVEGMEFIWLLSKLDQIEKGE